MAKGSNLKDTSLAIILCGGKGSRIQKDIADAIHDLNGDYERGDFGISLAELKNIEHCPKVLLPVLGFPLMFHRMHAFACHGVRHFKLLAGNRAAEIQAAIDPLIPAEWNVEYIPKLHPNMLAEVRAIVESRNDPVFISTGGAVSGADYSRMLENHIASDRFVTEGAYVRSAGGYPHATGDSILSPKIFLPSNAEWLEPHLRYDEYSGDFESSFWSLIHSHGERGHFNVTAYQYVRHIENYVSLLNAAASFEGVRELQLVQGRAITVDGTQRNYVMPEHSRQVAIAL
jgi:hypothetical protein